MDYYFKLSWEIRMMQAQCRPPRRFFRQTLASSGVAVLIRLHTALLSPRECPKASCCFLYIVIVIIFKRVDDIRENWVFLRYPRSNNHPIVWFLLVLKTRSNHQPTSSEFMSQIRAMTGNMRLCIWNYLLRIKCESAPPLPYLKINQLPCIFTPRKEFGSPGRSRFIG